MAHKMLCDGKGNKSSKRLFGAVGMTLFFFAAIAIAGYSVFTGNDVGTNAQHLVSMVGFVSGSLLGIGVVEKFAENKKEG